MNEKCQELRARLLTLRSELTDWFSSIESFRTPNAPPNQKACLWALNLRKEFDTLSEQIGELAADAGLTNELLAGVDELDECLNKIESSLAAKAKAVFEDAARRALATIEHLTYLGEGDPATMAKIKAALAEISREA